jgi:hypothetical protein
MAIRTLDNANSAFSLQIVGLFDAFVPQQGFGVDASIIAQPINPTEVSMGVDGLMGMGFTPQPKKITISYRSFSESIDMYDVWFNAMELSKQSFAANAVLIVPGIRQKYMMIYGGLTEYTPFPELKKTVEDRKFEITFQNIFRSPI